MEFRKVAYNNNTSVSSVMGHEWGTANSTNLKLVSQKKKRKKSQAREFILEAMMQDSNLGPIVEC